MNPYITQPLLDLADALDAAARALVTLERTLTSQVQGELPLGKEQETPAPTQKEAADVETSPEVEQEQPPMTLQEMSKFLTAVAKKYTAPVLGAALKASFEGKQKTIDDVAEGDRRAFVDRVVKAVREMTQ